VSEGKLYCKQCHILVRKIEGTMFIGKKEKKPPVEYVHTSTRSADGESSCGRRILTADDVEPLTAATEA